MLCADIKNVTERAEQCMKYLFGMTTILFISSFRYVSSMKEGFTT